MRFIKFGDDDVLSSTAAAADGGHGDGADAFAAAKNNCLTSTWDECSNHNVHQVHDDSACRLWVSRRRRRQQQQQQQ